MTIHAHLDWRLQRDTNQRNRKGHRKPHHLPGRCLQTPGASRLGGTSTLRCQNRLRDDA